MFQNKMNNFYETEVFTDLSFVGDEQLSDEFQECVFKNCNFSESFVNNCAFYECKFYNCTVKNMTFKDCEILNCEFYSCNLIGINWDDFTDGKRDGISNPIDKLENCFCKFNSFCGLNFVKFNLKKSQIIESNFIRCNCKEVVFNGCNLEKTIFSECDLSKSDFRNTSGWEISLASNNVKGAQFSFPEVVNLLNGLGIRWE